MAVHSEASVHPGFPVQERFKCMEAFLQIYRSENRRNNIINGGGKKKRDPCRKEAERGWQTVRKRGVNSGRVNSQGVFAGVRLRSCDDF